LGNALLFIGRFNSREGKPGLGDPDKPAMGWLPAERFDLSEWSRARVNID
jgi:hypothetical protein